ncbi:MAG: J domain-containing protein, partial [Okeania sp. SIO2C2]|uniref:J domain-containing protein n=1 Tax=Okeania sp. SIO2C2 TaxID=2607787 RepID=UPI0013B7858D
MDDIAKAYSVLELEPGASLQEVNQAYKDLVFIWHPDRIPADNERLRDKAQDKLKRLNEARSRLKQYLRHGSQKAATAGQAKTRPKTSKYNPERYGKRRYGTYSAYSQGEHSQPKSSPYSSAAPPKTAAPNNGNGRSPFRRQNQPNNQG